MQTYNILMIYKLKTQISTMMNVQFSGFPTNKRSRCVDNAAERPY